MNPLVTKMVGKRITAIYQVAFYAIVGFGISILLAKFGKNPFMNDYIFMLGIFIIVSTIFTSAYVIFVAYTYSIKFFETGFTIIRGFKKFHIELTDIQETRIKKRGDFYIITFFLKDETQYTIKSFNYASFDSLFNKLGRYYENGWELN